MIWQSPCGSRIVRLLSHAVLRFLVLGTSNMSFPMQKDGNGALGHLFMGAELVLDEDQLVPFAFVALAL